MWWSRSETGIAPLVILYSFLSAMNGGVEILPELRGFVSARSAHTSSLTATTSVEVLGILFLSVLRAVCINA